MKPGTLEKLAQCSSILNQGVPITPNDSLVLVRHNHKVRQSNNMVNTFLFLRIWPELLRDALISLSCQIKVFLLEWIGSFKHAFERVIVLDLPHDQRIHELDDGILVLLSPLFQLLSLFRCPGTRFLCLLDLLDALMNIEQICRFVSSLVTWYTVRAFIHVEELLKEFRISWLILSSCHILIEAHSMLRINIISFDVIIHLVLIKHGEGP